MKAALFLLILLVLATHQPVQATPQDDFGDLEMPRGAELQLHQSTKRILTDHKLKHVANQSPVEAIIALDRLRAEGDESAEDLAIAIAEVAIRGGQSSNSANDVGLFLCAASETYSLSLEQAAERGGVKDSDGGSLSALGLQVQAIEGLIEGLQELPTESITENTISLPGPIGDFELRWEVQAESWTPSTHRYVGASRFERTKNIEGARSGLGAPIVAIRRGDLPDKPDFEGHVFPVYEYYYPLTAVLSLGPVVASGPRQASVLLVDPRRVETITLDETKYPLAIDIGSQFLALRQETETASEIGGTRNAGRYMTLMGLYVLEPLRTDKIPLVLVHGLNSSQKTWEEAYEDLMLDRDLREGYQVWAFSYPTGLPFPYSAASLREALEETVRGLDPEGENPLLNRTVLVGHSMGGLLVRMQISDSGMTLWSEVFAKSPEEVGLDPQDLEIIRSVLVFESLPFVSRAVFFSVPHRGSKQAGNLLGKLGATLVELPESLKRLGERILASEQESLVGEAAERRKLPDGVQSLQPDYPVIKALDQLEIEPTVSYHSVVGDKGQGDTPDSSDGFVPYWSSHLDGAASEKIVPSGHSSHKHPEGIEELLRILHEHLDSVGASD